MASPLPFMPRFLSASAFKRLCGRKRQRKLGGTERQTGKQRQEDGKGHTEMSKRGEGGKKTDNESKRDRQTDREGERQTDRQRHRERQTDRERERGWGWT